MSVSDSSRYAAGGRRSSSTNPLSVRRRSIASAASLAIVCLSLFGGGAARADIFAGPDATRICAGYEGGGIDWSISLNEGWRASPLIRYRVILRDPENKIVDFKESSRVAGGWLGPYPYWDNGRVTANPVVGTNSLGEPTAGC